jgi:predicted DNA-binding protein (MmcQ/YjbR family)
MTVDSVRKFCMSFPRATENLQWEEDLCFKVNGKIFAVLALGSVPQKMTFKCNPETFAELTEREGIVPAPYVGRYKWVQLDRLDALTGPELEDLIGQSYEMVTAKAKSAGTKKREPEARRKKIAG